jgi:hypothetical protein
MKIAVKELRGFLATNPENPDLARTAKEAEQRVLEWQVERHLGIAAFYRRIGNLAGEMRHLELAAGPEFAGTARHGEAATARDNLRLGRAGAGQ